MYPQHEVCNKKGCILHLWVVAIALHQGLKSLNLKVKRQIHMTPSVVHLEFLTRFGIWKRQQSWLIQVCKLSSIKIQWPYRKECFMMQFWNSKRSLPTSQDLGHRECHGLSHFCSWCGTDNRRRSQSYQYFCQYRHFYNWPSRPWWLSVWVYSGEIQILSRVVNIEHDMWWQDILQNRL